METNQSNEPNRADLDQQQGAAMIEFGASWCGYCQAAQPIIASALINYPRTLHIKIEDGKARRLGRSYSIKLWPTLIFLKNGTEIKRLVRPDNSEVITKALAEINIK
jgi:thioredoxin 1